MSTTDRDFDLSPVPRVLPMLGEISLHQWQCIAELVDNCVDGFLAAHRAGESVSNPTIDIAIPTADVPSAKITVTDNGPGMDADTLERAVKAGWSGNSPIDSLGLFGMGFNIATARLGMKTHVWTTRTGDPEWRGLCIDFEKLTRQHDFKTPRLTRPKADPYQHGTEVSIEGLKPEQRAWFTKAANRTRISKELSKVYSAMLRANGVPISFKLSVNGSKVEPRNYCVWAQTRIVNTQRYGSVAPIVNVDIPLANRKFCTQCWQWLAAEGDTCPTCESSEFVVERERRIRGWLGIQRYLSVTDYGIDLLRNGRKIELASRDLFSWRDGEQSETEYPIDDPRNRGRIVGEIHIDHCRVHYTKDRFDRNDPAWEDMIRGVRGEAPLRPDKARSLGMANDTPLATLFNTFRRSSPKPKIAGAWKNLLVVSNNEEAERMADRFYANDPGYLEDTKWWELIEEEERKLLVEDRSSTQPQPTDLADELLDDPEDESPGEPAPATGSPSPAPPQRDRVPSLTKEFRHDPSELRWDVRAWNVQLSDPELLPAGAPWRMLRSTAGHHDFYVCLSHPIFQSATLTGLDALLGELAAGALDFLRGRTHDNTYASILSDLRGRYASTSRLEPVTLSSEAALVLADLAKSLAQNVESADDGVALFGELGAKDQEDIRHKMAARQIRDPELVIAQGRFLEFATNRALVAFFQRHPEMFFDGHYFEQEYATLEYGLAAATADARDKALSYYLGLLADAVWLAEQDPGDLASADRERLLRASLALDLLTGIPPDDE